jgi:hypothetical protein
MRRLPTFCLLGLALLMLTPSATAQVDPSDAVRKIAETIEKEMSEIDRLLRESSRAGGANAEASSRIRELIDGTRQSQGKVVQGIDDLIGELEKMAQQSQSQSQQSSQPPQDQQQSGQQGQQGQQGQEQQGQQRPGGQGNRRENQTPDLAQQPNQGEQSGDQEPGQQGQPQNQPQNQPSGADSPGEEQRREGRNTQTGAAAEGSSERVERQDGAEGWGSLQKYVPPQYQRAGAPQVPARYRRLHEAFQKRAHQTQKSGG